MYYEYSKSYSENDGKMKKPDWFILTSNSFGRAVKYFTSINRKEASIWKCGVPISSGIVIELIYKILILVLQQQTLNFGIGEECREMWGFI